MLNLMSGEQCAICHALKLEIFLTNQMLWSGGILTLVKQQLLKDFQLESLQIHSSWVDYAFFQKKISQFPDNQKANEQKLVKFTIVERKFPAVVWGARYSPPDDHYIC